MDRQLELSGNPLHNKITFAKIVKSQDPTIEDWQIKFLKEQLFADKFLEYAKYGDGEPFTLTPAGIKAAQTGWYVAHSEKGEQEKIIRTETIKDFNRSRKAVNISIIAIIVPTIISLGALWLSRQQPTTEEVQQVKERVHKLNSKLDQQKTTLDSLTKLFGDTLKKVNHGK
jgi:cell division protein FtsL